MEHQVTTREELARKDAELNAASREKDGLRSELEKAVATHKHLQETVRVVEESYGELQGEKDGLMKQINQLENKVEREREREREYKCT